MSGDEDLQPARIAYPHDPLGPHEMLETKWPMWPKRAHFAFHDAHPVVLAALTRS